MTKGGASLASRIFIQAVLALGLVACDGGTGRSVPGPSPTPTASVAPVVTARPARDLAAAERAAYPQGLIVASGDGPAIHFEHGKLIDTPFGPVLANEGRIPDGAHAESGTIAITYLKRHSTGYQVVARYPDAIQLGSFGALTEWAVSTKFGDLPVIYAEGGGTWQGYSCGKTVLTELRETGPVEIASFGDSYDNGSALEGAHESIAGKIADIVPGRSFKVRYTGTQHFEESWIRQGDHYVLQGPDRVKQC